MRHVRHKITTHHLEAAAFTDITDEHGHTMPINRTDMDEQMTLPRRIHRARFDATPRMVPTLALMAIYCDFPVTRLPVSRNHGGNLREIVIDKAGIADKREITGGRADISNATAVIHNDKHVRHHVDELFFSRTNRALAEHARHPTQAVTGTGMVTVRTRYSGTCCESIAVAGVPMLPGTRAASPTVPKQDGERQYQHRNNHDDHGNRPLMCVHRSSLCRNPRRLRIKRNLADVLAYPSLIEVRLLLTFEGTLPRHAGRREPHATVTAGARYRWRDGRRYLRIQRCRTP